MTEQTTPHEHRMIDTYIAHYQSVPLPPWGEPRRVDVWWWLDLNLWQTPGVLWRCGRVSWNQDGTGLYDVAFHDEIAGIDIPLYVEFQALSDAQEFIESIIAQPLRDIQNSDAAHSDR